MLFAEIVTAYNHNFPGIYAGENLLDIDIYFHNYNSKRHIFHFGGIDGDAICWDHNMSESRIAAALRGLIRTTGEFAHPVTNLIRVKKCIFTNSVRDISYVGKVAAVVLVIAVSLYSALAGTGMFAALDFMVRNDPPLLLPLTNLALFFVFISNILAVVFIGGSRILLFDKLIYYPIETWQSVAMEVITGMVEPLNLVFLPIYIAACFFPNNPLTPVTVISSFLLVLLFILLVSNISFLIRITVAVGSSFRSLRRTMAFAMFALTAAAFILIAHFGWYIATKEHVLAMSGILNYLPSGAWIDGIFGLGTANPVHHLLVSGIYLLWMNILVIWLNLRATPALKRLQFPRGSGEVGKGKNSFTRRVGLLGKDPLAKKNIIYALRSSRNLVRLSMFFALSLSFPVYYFLKSRRTVFSPQHEGLILLMTFVFLWEGLMTQCGSVFSNDYYGIVNYFFRPVSPEGILSSKRAVPKYLGISGALIILTTALLMRDDPISALVVGALVLLAEFTLIEAGLLLSVFLIKPASFRWSMSPGQFDIAAVSVFPSIPIAGTFAVAAYFIMTLRLTRVGEAAVLCTVLLLFIPFFRVRRRTDRIIGRILTNRKEKVIKRCRKMS